MNENKNTSNCASQRQEIQRHLEAGNPLTGMQALNRYGCARLAARIEELRVAEYRALDLLPKNGG